MKGGMGNLMKQAQKMQADMQKAQEEIAQMEVTGQAGGGMVSVTLNGKHECKRVEIDSSLFGDDDDREMIGDLVAAAFNDAARKVHEASQERMQGMTEGLGLPPGMKLPF